MNYMEQKQILEFKEPREWVLGERKIKVSKIETSTHIWSPVLSKHEEFENINPQTAIKDIIKNVGLLPNATFLERDSESVIARIQDLVDYTLIRTQWIIPKSTFNVVVSLLTHSQGIPDYKFYITSKIS